jgi:cytochrome oxidase assembly protein ShyY1
MAFSSNWRAHLSLKFVCAVLLTVALFSVLVKLGLWQWQRGLEKQQLEELYQAREVHDYQPLAQWWPIQAKNEAPIASTNVNGIQVKLTAEQSKQPFIFLDNQVYQAEVGYLVYQIVWVKDVEISHYLLVELGFVSASLDRTRLPAIEPLTSTDLAELSGRIYAKSSLPFGFELMHEKKSVHNMVSDEIELGMRIQHLNFTELSDVLTLPLLPFALQPDNQTQLRYPQPWQPLSMHSTKHFGYSFQWFSMALVLALIGLWILRKWARKINAKELK